MKVLPAALARKTGHSCNGSAGKPSGSAAEQPAHCPDPRLRGDRRPAVCEHAADRGPRPTGSCWLTGRWNLSGRCAIIEQVAKALHAAHKIGLVHRDVKPSNILLDRRRLRLSDRLRHRPRRRRDPIDRHRQHVGSWPYMSPERLRAGQVDARSDIYALACVLYECLTGSRLSPADNFEQQITAHLTAPPPRPSSTDPNVPASDRPGDRHRHGQRPRPALCHHRRVSQRRPRRHHHADGPPASPKSAHAPPALRDEPRAGPRPQPNAPRSNSPPT